MVVAVAGVWELGYSAPLTERDLWLFPLREFGVDQWFMSPISGIREQHLTELHDLQGLIKATELTCVYVDERGTTELGDFAHPDDALYILGKASFSPLAALGSPGDQSLRIRTPIDSGMLWPHQAISIVLYDRAVKSWR